MNLFEKIIQDKDLKCDICGYSMIVVHGGGWENDLIYCSNTDCGAEIEFPTTTLLPSQKEETKSITKPYKTTIVFHWECPHCIHSQVSYINFDEPWVVECEDCNTMIEIDDDDIVRNEDKEHIQQMNRVSESYCCCNSPLCEPDSNNCGECGKTLRSKKFPFECLNCGQSFTQPHSLVTYKVSKSGIPHKEMFCCPACEDYYYKNSR